MKASTSLSLALAALTTAAATAAIEPVRPAWEQIGEDDGIKVFRMEIPESPVVAFRGEGVIDAPLLRAVSVMVDTARAHEWMDSMEEARILRKISDLEYVVYNHVGTPFVMKDRDFVSSNKMEFDPARKSISLKVHSVDDPAAPRTDHVRAELINSSFVFTSIEGGKKTHLVAEIHADPKGSVPKWVVNLFQKAWPHNTISALRKQVAKPGIRDNEVIRAEMARLGF